MNIYRAQFPPNNPANRLKPIASSLTKVYTYFIWKSHFKLDKRLKTTNNKLTTTLFLLIKCVKIMRIYISLRPTKSPIKFNKNKSKFNNQIKSNSNKPHKYQLPWINNIYYTQIHCIPTINNIRLSNPQTSSKTSSKHKPSSSPKTKMTIHTNKAPSIQMNHHKKTANPKWKTRSMMLILYSIKNSKKETQKLKNYYKNTQSIRH